MKTFLVVLQWILIANLFTEDEIQLEREFSLMPEACPSQLFMLTLNLQYILKSMS